VRSSAGVDDVSRAGGLNGIATARCRAEGPTFRAAKCAHLGASAQGRLRRPSDRYHAARPGDSKSQEAAQRDLREAYWPAAAEDRRGAGARFFYDGRDGQGFRLSRQGNRSSAGDTTACSRVLNGHCIVVIPLWKFSPSIRERCDWLTGIELRNVCFVPKADVKGVFDGITVGSNDLNEAGLIEIGTSQSVCGGASSSLSLAVNIAIRTSASARVRFGLYASSS